MEIQEVYFRQYQQTSKRGMLQVLRCPPVMLTRVDEEPDHLQ